MMALGAAIFAVFGVYGMITLAEQLCRRLCRGSCCDRVLIYVKSESENVEATVRTLMLNNPGAEIIVADEGKSRELREILDRLCAECAQVHIARYEPKL